MTMLIPPMPNGIRKLDPMGSGKFNSSRGNRKHYGVDIVGQPGERVLAPCDGTVLRLGICYEDPAKMHLKLIEIEADMYFVRLLYVMPLVAVGEKVIQGRVVGTCQNVAAVHPNGRDEIVMTNHVHMDVRIKSGHVLEGPGYPANERVFIDPLILMEMPDAVETI